MAQIIERRSSNLYLGKMNCDPQTGIELNRLTTDETL